MSSTVNQKMVESLHQHYKTETVWTTDRVCKTQRHLHLNRHKRQITALVSEKKKKVQKTVQ